MSRNDSGSPLMRKSNHDGSWVCFSGSASTTTGADNASCNLTKILTVFCAFCVTVTIGVAVLVAVVFAKYYHSISGGPDAEEFAFCVPCETLLSRQTEHGKDLIRRQKTYNGKLVEMCCGKDVKGLDNIVDKLVQLKVEEKMKLERKFRLEPAKIVANTSIRPAIAAHFVLSQRHDEANLAGEDGLFKIQGWRHRSYQDMVVRRNIEYRHGGLRVNKTGIFYIYSQVHFVEKNRNAPSGYKTRVMSHYVYRYSRNLPKEKRILQNSVSMCVFDKTMSHTSYVGGVFYLEAGDLVYVKVNNLTSVHPNPAVTYFGLLMLDTSSVKKK